MGTDASNWLETHAPTIGAGAGGMLGAGAGAIGGTALGALYWLIARSMAKKGRQPQLSSALAIGAGLGALTGAGAGGYLGWRGGKETQPNLAAQRQRFDRIDSYMDEADRWRERSERAGPMFDETLDRVDEVSEAADRAGDWGDRNLGALRRSALEAERRARETTSGVSRMSGGE